MQDAAAALPARLLGPVEGLSVVDLCAAPGGKAAQLAAAGAVVTAVDLSALRLERVRANFERLKGYGASILPAGVGFSAALGRNIKGALCPFKEMWPLLKALVEDARKPPSGEPDPPPPAG